MFNQIKSILLFTFIFLTISSNAFASYPIEFNQKKDLFDLNEYAGAYKMAEGSPIDSLKFYVKEGKLFVDAGEHGSAELKNIDKDTFEEPNYKAIFVFTRKNGLVTGFTETVRSIEMIGVKVIDN